MMTNATYSGEKSISFIGLRKKMLCMYTSTYVLALLSWLIMLYEKGIRYKKMAQPEAT